MIFAVSSIHNCLKGKWVGEGVILIPVLAIQQMSKIRVRLENPVHGFGTICSNYFVH